jgi:galactokinase
VTDETALGALIQSGMELADAARIGELADRVVVEHRRQTGQPPDWCWFVPGRVEVFGKHTDYAGGRSLVGAVPRGMVVAAAPRTDQVVRVSDVGRRQNLLIRVGDTTTDYVGWPNYVAVVLRRFAANFSDAPLGADITIDSNLPSAAGMSSSSVLIVGMATALARRGVLTTRAEWIDAIHGPLDLAGYLAAVEAGADFGPLSGGFGVGTHGGSEDHTAILASLPRRLCAFQFVPIRAAGQAQMPPEWRFVIAVSGVAADKTGTARERFNRLARAARALVELWNRRHGTSYSAIARALEESDEAADELFALIDADRDASGDAALLRTRLQHFLREDRRVGDALHAFTERDSQALADLSAASQADAEALLGNQVDETIALASLAPERGAFAATAFGSGFGGSVWALVDEGHATEFSARWLEAYKRKFTARLNAQSFVMVPGSGIVEIPVVPS